jgi:hypothetical protein
VILCKDVILRGLGSRGTLDVLVTPLVVDGYGVVFECGFRAAVSKSKKRQDGDVKSPLQRKVGS